MKDPLSDLASLVAHSQAGITDIFRKTSARPERALHLADLLLNLCPRAGLAACLLGGVETGRLAVRPERALDEEQGKQLRAQLASVDALASGVQRLSCSSRPDLKLLATAIHDSERARGFLVLGMSSGEAEERARAEALLAICAPAVALRWALESARGEQSELARFALVGQAFAGLAHELNNALNSMMLQTSVVQLRVDQQTRQDLSAIRQHGAQAAGLVRSLQHIVMERREQFYPVDLGGILTEVLEDDAELRRRVTFEQAGEVPPIPSTHTTVKQLVQVLLEGVLAGTKSTVVARTEKQNEAATLTLTLAEGSAEMSDGEPSPLDALLWQNLDEVGRQAGQSLLRQLGGTPEVEVHAGGGVTLRFRWETTSGEVAE